MNIKKIALIGLAVFLLARYLGNRTGGQNGGGIIGGASMSDIPTGGFSHTT